MNRDRTKTVLLAWELGSGFGHVDPLRKVGEALEREGHRLVWAVSDPIRSRAILQQTSWPVLPAPRWIPPRIEGAEPFLAGSFADILSRHGYADVDILRMLVRSWESIYSAIQPDLMVADFAPTAVFAAHRRFPIVDIGNGFSQPPIHRPTFPLLVSNRTPPRSESEILANVHTIQQERGRRVSDTLPQTFRPSVSRVLAYPELDPYHAIRPDPAVGPLDPPPSPVPLRGEPRFFAYLSADAAGTVPALTLLAQAGFHGEAYIRDATPAMRDILRSTGILLHEKPVSLTDALTKSRVFVHHGGMKSSCQALATGRPQLLFPRYLEQQLTASVLHRLGVAHYLTDRYPAEDVAEGMRQLMCEDRFQQTAQEKAWELHRHGPWAALDRIVEDCRRLLS